MRQGNRRIHKSKGDLHSSDGSNLRYFLHTMNLLLVLEVGEVHILCFLFLLLVN